LTNSGKSVAKDVSFSKVGEDIEVQGLESIKILKAKEKREIPLKIKTNVSGKSNLVIDITFCRIFDGKINEVKLDQEIEIGEQKLKEPAFKKVKAEETYKCYACNGKVKPGLMVIKCNCGNTYHEACGERLGKCPMCGTMFKKNTSTKKKLALKIG
jgi:hypothetical protein